ncbi:MAG: thioredoxin family protein [Flavobacteriales bacterium]
MKDRAMKGIDGKEHTLQELAGKEGLMLIFTCNTCPFVKAWNDRYKKVQKLGDTKGVRTVLLNSNTRKRDAGDAIKDMKSYAREHHAGIPYLLDKKNKVADAVGAKTTPHVFLFNDELKLVYRGKIDDNYKDPEKVQEFFVKDALRAMLAGKKADPATTEPKGCSIKRE